MQLPPAEKLLGDILRLEPHTQKGQWAAAEYVQELVIRHNLGTAQILKYHERIDGTGDEYPLLKINAEVGSAPPGKSRELMTWLGHLDTVEPIGAQMENDALQVSGKKGIGRGSLDMWGGNIAYLHALNALRESGSANVLLQVILSSREELDSTVLFQAIKNGDVEKAKIGATTEILVGDDGANCPLYLGRTGRIGIEMLFKGESAHAGRVDRNPKIRNRIAHRGHGRFMDEVLDEDEERAFFIENMHPDDHTHLLPTRSHAIPGRTSGDPKGLSVPHEIFQHINIFPSDPRISAERALALLRDYVIEKARVLPENVELWLEERDIPFIEPWFTSPDHPLAIAAHTYAEQIAQNTVERTAASGVAEEGLIHQFHQTPFVGWAPKGKGAHEDAEEVEIESIAERAEWLKLLAQHDGNLT